MILENVIELADVGVPHFLGNLKNGVLMACTEVCGKRSGGEAEDICWWNEEL